MVSILFKAAILGLKANKGHTSVLVKVTHAGDVDLEELDAHRLVEPVIGTFRLAPDTLATLAKEYEDYGIQEIAKGSVIYFTAKGIEEESSGTTRWGAPIHRFACFREESLSPAITSRRSGKLMTLQTVAPTISQIAGAACETVRVVDGIASI